ncbi:right-handed parallel beta-helix repeat-containing protein [Micromonospora sp. CPCC 205371]|nr:right-handed parallel beta-helix repeat-containing protein [Micromonospora sp. CPCC 205371]
MRAPFRAGVTALAVTSGALFGTAAAAHAADPKILYVQATSASCSDSGPGTAAQPFCTISAAAAIVTAGQTVEIGTGTYRERVTIPRSGTPGQPITFRMAPVGGRELAGPTAGFVIDGQHHIRLERIQVSRARDLPALDIRDSSAITIEWGSFTLDETATAPAIRLAGVTASQLNGPYISGWLGGGGLSMDAATTGVIANAVTARAPGLTRAADGSIGIDVAGPGNTIINSLVQGYGGAGIMIGPDATGTVVTNNWIYFGAGYGIHNRGAAGTAITNNAVRSRCLDGIRIDGPSSGVSVQNNVLINNGHLGQTYCQGGPLDGVELAVYDDAIDDTVVDYNDAYHYQANSPNLYSWNGTPMGLAAFRTASGQSTNDKEAALPKDHQDSANSTAPGYSATDRTGKARADDPTVPNTGAGPVTYADRGPVETIRRPTALTIVTANVTISTVTVDASTSQPGWLPITAYTFSFGDGTTITQTSPRITHRYRRPGKYSVLTTVTATDGLYSSRTDLINLLPWTSTGPPSADGLARRHHSW